MVREEKHLCTERVGLKLLEKVGQYLLFISVFLRA